MKFRDVQKVLGGKAKFESPKGSGGSIFGECVGWFVKFREVQNSVIQGKIDQGLVVKIRLWY